jgi:hypothetical protein
MKPLDFVKRLIYFIIIFLSVFSCKTNTFDLAEHYSGLTIPKSAKIDTLIDLGNNRGERVFFMKIKFGKEDQLKLNKEILREKFKKLPIIDDIIPPEQNGVEVLRYLSAEKQKEFLYTDTNKTVEGYYHIKKSKLNRNIELVIIDELTWEIIIYVLIL